MRRADPAISPIPTIPEKVASPFSSGGCTHTQDRPGRARRRSKLRRRVDHYNSSLFRRHLPLGGSKIHKT